jgi:hypothetical protein
MLSVIGRHLRQFAQKARARASSVAAKKPQVTTWQFEKAEVSFIGSVAVAVMN